MSLTVDGFWKAGFWNTGFWAAGFWQEGASTPATTGFAGGGGSRHFTPIQLSARKKKQIDAVIRKEIRLKEQIQTVQERGSDIYVLDSLADNLREIQIAILRLALESAQAQTYIALKRIEEQAEEDEDISFILSILDE